MQVVSHLWFLYLNAMTHENKVVNINNNKQK